MTAKMIIAEAWNFTRAHRNFMWWYSFIPAILATLIGILYVLYQFFAFKKSALFSSDGKGFLGEALSATVGFLNENGNLWIPAVTVTLLILILYALLPTLCQGALIQIIAKKKNGDHLTIVQGFSLGLLTFLPLLEYHLLIKAFSIISLLTEAAFVLRNLGPGALTTLLPVFILASVIGLALTLLFTYSEFFIVLDKKHALASMGMSAKLVLVSWQHTFLIAILMLIIGLRIIVNILAVLLVPALLFASAAFLATTTFTKIGIAIGILMSVIGLLFASYFTGILNVFANTVWTMTYMELRKEKLSKEAIGE